MQKASLFYGNHAPFIHPIFHFTNPNTKGCRQFSKLIAEPKFDKNQWKNFENLAATHNLDHDSPISQIIKLTNTSKLIEGKDLQYLVLRNTCLTNSKLYSMNIVPTPECMLCLHPAQDSSHRFYFCPFIKPVWDFLSEITENTSISHTFSFSCAIINVKEASKNSFNKFHQDTNQQGSQ